jgi:hypothetical protein
MYAGALLDNKLMLDVNNVTNIYEEAKLSSLDCNTNSCKQLSKECNKEGVMPESTGK